MSKKFLKQLQTYSAKIYCGLKEGYFGSEHTENEVINICQKYCNEVGLGVTITPTTFVYTDGCERGVVVGLINYPRFPSTKYKIREHATAIAEELMDTFKQKRITIEYTDWTQTLTSIKEDKEDNEEDNKKS